MASFGTTEHFRTPTMTIEAEEHEISASGAPEQFKTGDQIYLCNFSDDPWMFQVPEYKVNYPGTVIKTITEGDAQLIGQVEIQFEDFIGLVLPKFLSRTRVQTDNDASAAGAEESKNENNEMVSGASSSRIKPTAEDEEEKELHEVRQSLDDDQKSHMDMLRKHFLPLSKRVAPVGGSVSGSLTIPCLVKIARHLVEKKIVTSQTKFADLGSEVGKVVAATALFGKCTAIGIECVAQRHQFALQAFHSLHAAMDEEANCLPVGLVQGDILEMKSLGPIDFVWLFDAAYEDDLKQHIGDLLKKSSVQFIMTCITPSELVELGYPFRPVTEITEDDDGNTQSTHVTWKGSMFGNGGSRTMRLMVRKCCCGCNDDCSGSYTKCGRTGLRCLPCCIPEEQITLSSSTASSSSCSSSSSSTHCSSSSNSSSAHSSSSSSSSSAFNRSFSASSANSNSSSKTVGFCKGCVEKGDVTVVSSPLVDELLQKALEMTKVTDMEEKIKQFTSLFTHGEPSTTRRRSTQMVSLLVQL